MKLALALTTVPLAMLSLACTTTSSEPAPGGAVSIAVQQALTGQTSSAGTFQMSGALADQGNTTEELIFGGPLDQSPVPVTFRRVMTGRDGVIVVTGAATLTFSTPTAATLRGTWTVASATGKYASYEGSGTLSGAANFGVVPPTATIAYTGSIVR